jgi:tRNA(fMet)-specific endonuclease VapC
MKQYLIDTNICVYYIKGLFNLHEKFAKIGADNLSISEINILQIENVNIT